MSENGVKGESERIAADACSGAKLEGRESLSRGAKLLGIPARQLTRLRLKRREGGVRGLLHGNRDNAP